MGRADVKVVMWSYPVIQDGLIYVVDLRNGLYILKYNGPYEDEVNQTKFLEGNSNQGDALCIEPVPGATNVYCDTQRDVGAGGTVPATLSLTLGGPATFGAVHAGHRARLHRVDDRQRDLDRRRRDAERGRPERAEHRAPGQRHVLPAVEGPGAGAQRGESRPATTPTSARPPRRRQLLTYSGPISNDAVTLGFRQAIGANDALRTGPYSKTLTFTLSTTTP